MNISETIFYQLSKRGISQKEFSKMTGIPESTISDWKKKGNTPKAEKLYDISKALGISLYELLGVGDKFIDAKLQSNSKSKDEIDADLLIQKQLARKLRRLARLNRITIIENKNSFVKNKKPFEYFDYLGIDKLEYVKQYLSAIQPFMLTEMKSQEKFENAVCVLDGYYRISIYIKVDATKGEEIIVSFHENNKNGIARVNPIKRDDYVYVFADSVGSHLKNTDDYSINLFITRGVRTFPINVPARKYDDEGFLVRYSYINNALIDISNRYLEDLYTADIDFSDVEPFSSLQQLSFTPFGNDIFSNISLLIDSILIQKDAIGRQVSDAALVIYCNSLELLEADKKELLLTLKERFKVNSSRVVPRLLERIESNISE